MKMEQAACALCGGSLAMIKDRLRDQSSAMRVYRCGSCSHTQLWPMPTPEEDREYYNQNLQDRSRKKEIDYAALRANQSFDTDRHVQMIKDRFAPGASVLDVGAGYGFFLDALKEHGYSVRGLEVSEERRSLALANTTVAISGHDVFEGPSVIGRHDVVTLFHVLEHVTDPVRFARALGELLLPGGTLIVEVPNVDDMLLSNSPEYNDFYWIRAHLHYFNAANLVKVLKAAGYPHVEVSFAQRYGLLNLSNWLMYGRPQIEKPVFHIAPDYQEVEAFYRRSLETAGRADAMLAFARR